MREEALDIAVQRPGLEGKCDLGKDKELERDRVKAWGQE